MLQYTQIHIQNKTHKKMSSNLNTQSSGESMSDSAKYFAKCGGNTIPTLLMSAPDDREKRIRMGKVVFLITLVSGLIASVAWSIPMGIKGVVVGLPWFIVMLYLESMILQQMDDKVAQKKYQRWLNGDFSENNSRGTAGIGWLLMRVILVVGISYFNSEMVRILLFKPEIVAEIKLRQDSEAAHIADSLHKQELAIAAKIKQKEDEVTHAQEALGALIVDYRERIAKCDDSIDYWTAMLPREINGSGGLSKQRGDKFVANGIRETITRFQTQKQQLAAEMDKAGSESAEASTIGAFEKVLKDERKRGAYELAQIKKVKKELIQKILDRPANGLSFMLSVLNDISGRSTLIWMVFVIFFLIELIPVMLKFSSKSDSFNDIRAHEFLEREKDSNEKARAVYDALKKLNAPNP